MTIDASRSGSRPEVPVLLLPALALLLGVLAAVGTLLAARHSAALGVAAEVRAGAASAVVPTTDALRDALSTATSSSAPGVRTGPVSAAERLGITVESAVIARDSGSPTLDDSGDGAVVAATYDTGSDPGSVAERRRHVTGLRVVPLQLDATLFDFRPTDGGVVLHGPSRVVAALPGPPEPGAKTFTVPLTKRVAPDWSVSVWAPDPSPPLTAWVIAGGALIVGGLVGSWLLVVGRRSHRAAVDLTRLRDQSATVARLAAVAQGSLELAHVLPAVATELSTKLELRGLRVTSITAEGERLLFRWGDLPGQEPDDDGTSGHSSLPARATAGVPVTTLLERGGRSIARLTVVTGRDLDPLDMGTLEAGAEILASALANAETYKRQSELLARLRSVDELKSVFLSTASHELRTPVGVITGYAKLLSANWDTLTSSQGKEYAQRIDANADRLRALVEDLLDFSRIERGIGVHAGSEVLDLGKEVGEVLDQQSYLSTHHVLARFLTPGVQVRGSRQAIERIVGNLVGNAVKYSPAPSTVTISVHERRGRALLVVEDEGPGVAPEEREKVFSRFYRGSGDEVVRTRGAGLGLAIVQEFASALGGTVSVERADSGGARFLVALPVHRGEAPAGQVAAPAADTHVRQGGPDDRA